MMKTYQAMRVIAKTVIIGKRTDIGLTDQPRLARIHAAGYNFSFCAPTSDSAPIAEPNCCAMLAPRRVPRLWA
jgi:hypothetical protein